MRPSRSSPWIAVAVAIVLLLGVGYLTTLSNPGPLDPSTAPLADDDAAAADPADDETDTAPLPGERELIGERDRDDDQVARAIARGAMAQPVWSNAHRRETARKFPETPEQREAFIELVLVPQDAEALRNLADGLRRKYRQDLDPDLTPADQRQAAAAIERLVAAEWTFRAAKHEALLDYIRTAPSLAAVVRSDNHGDGGVVVHGVDAELRRHWGNAVDVAVRYWLPFDKYRRLAAAQQSLAACRRELARFQVQR